MALNPHDYRGYIEGWSSDILPYYHDLAPKLPVGGVFVEVGIYRGRSLCYLIERLHELGNFTIVSAVDNWDWHPEDWDKFIENLRSTGLASSVCCEMGGSVSAAEWRKNESIDFCFLDASHDYENVKADLTAWWPKIKPGGVFAGHDYSGVAPDNPHRGVAVAVDEFFKARGHHNLISNPKNTTIWEVTKP
jgi:predicted O-methyltransferase YrrM